MQIFEFLSEATCRRHKKLCWISQTLATWYLPAFIVNSGKRLEFGRLGRILLIAMTIDRNLVELNCSQLVWKMNKVSMFMVEEKCKAVLWVDLAKVTRTERPKPNNPKSYPNRHEKELNRFRSEIRNSNWPESNPNWPELLLTQCKPEPEMTRTDLYSN